MNVGPRSGSICTHPAIAARPWTANRSRLLACFGLAPSPPSRWDSPAWVLCPLGIFGLPSYTQGQRQHELGGRLAFGAQRSHVWRLGMRHTVAALLVGAAVGATGGAALSRFLVACLFDIGTWDPPSYAAACALMTFGGSLVSSTSTGHVIGPASGQISVTGVPVAWSDGAAL